MKSFGKNEVIEDQLILPKTSGKGIQVGGLADGGDWAWRDITSDIISHSTGSPDLAPTWSQVGATDFWFYKFDVNDMVWLTFHIPHDIVPNSQIHLHAHWFASGSDTTNAVKWQWQYAYGRGFGQDSLATSLGTVTAEEASAGNLKHMVTETSAITITNLSEPDGIMHCVLKRVTAGSPENTDDVFLLTSDIHYQSTNMGTKGKAPGFYT